MKASIPPNPQATSNKATTATICTAAHPIDDRIEHAKRDPPFLRRGKKRVMGLWVCSLLLPPPFELTRFKGWGVGKWVSEPCTLGKFFRGRGEELVVQRVYSRHMQLPCDPQNCTLESCSILYCWEYTSIIKFVLCMFR